MERACIGLEYLISDGQWKTVGSGFEKIDDFLKSIDLSQFKIAVDRRKKLAKRLEDLQATQRATAKALGVGLGTVQRDVDPNGSKQPTKVVETQAESEYLDPNGSTPLSVSGRQVMQTAEKRTERQKDSQSTKSPEIRESRVDLRKGDFRKVLSDIKDGSVSLVLTDPPYGKKYLELWTDLGKFASRVLSPTGILVTYSGQMYLQSCLSALSESLLYWWAGAVVHKGSSSLSPLGHPVRKVINQWKPLLMFVRKDGEGFERVFRDLADGQGPEKDSHNWQQPVGEAVWLINQFTLPGGLVVDPMAGSGTVGMACKETGRAFIGAELL